MSFGRRSWRRATWRLRTAPERVEQDPRRHPAHGRERRPQHRRALRPARLLHATGRRSDSQANEILPIDGNVALNANMSALMDLYKSNHVAISRVSATRTRTSRTSRPRRSGRAARQTTPQRPAGWGATWTLRLRRTPPRRPSTSTTSSRRPWRASRSSPSRSGHLNGFKLSPLGKITAASQQVDIQTLNKSASTSRAASPARSTTRSSPR